MVVSFVFSGNGFSYEFGCEIFAFGTFLGLSEIDDWVLWLKIGGRISGDGIDLTNNCFLPRWTLPDKVECLDTDLVIAGLPSRVCRGTDENCDSSNVIPRLVNARGTIFEEHLPSLTEDDFWTFDPGKVLKFEEEGSAVAPLGVKEVVCGVG